MLLGLLEGAGIRQQENAVGGIEQEMVAAMRADLKVLLQLENVYQRATFWALDPKSFRYVIAFLLPAQEWFLENAHEIVFSVRPAQRGQRRY